GFRHAFYAIGAMGLFAFVFALVILSWDKPVCPRGDGGGGGGGGGGVVAENDDGVEEEDDEEEEGEDKAATVTMNERDSAAGVLALVGNDSDDASSVCSQPERLGRGGGGVQDLERGHHQPA
ncbi:hypothetical protein BGW39_003067, partial [Mortierella sp. 14UC]